MHAPSLAIRRTDPITLSRFYIKRRHPDTHEVRKSRQVSSRQSSCQLSRIKQTVWECR